MFNFIKNKIVQFINNRKLKKRLAELRKLDPFIYD